MTEPLAHAGFPGIRQSLFDEHEAARCSRCQGDGWVFRGHLARGFVKLCPRCGGTGREA